MDKLFFPVLRTGGRRGTACLLLLSLLLLAGLVAGAGVACNVAEPARYFAAVSDGAFSFSAVLRRFLSLYKYHFAAFFFGLSFFGVLLIPLLSALRGFLLAFSVTAAYRSVAAGSLWVSLSLFAIPVLITLPCFLWMAVRSMETAADLFAALSSGGRRNPGALDLRFVAVLLLTTLIVLLGAALDCAVTPALYQLALKG